MKKILGQTEMNSLLGNAAVIRPKGKGLKKPLVATLILTSLVDVFSILVIYLLVNTSSSVEIPLSQKIELPTASQSNQITPGLVVRIVKKDLYIDEQPASYQELLSRMGGLSDEQKKEGVIIQADKKMNYEGLSPLLMAAAKAGLSKVRFAVMQGGSQ